MLKETQIYADFIKTHGVIVKKDSFSYKGKTVSLKLVNGWWIVNNDLRAKGKKSAIYIYINSKQFSRIAIPSGDPVISYITKHFRIIWRHRDEIKTQAIGVGVYHQLVGDAYAKKHFAQAMETKKELLEFRIRGRYVVQFQSI